MEKEKTGPTNAISDKKEALTEKKKGTQELEQLRLKQGLKRAQREMARLLELVRRAFGGRRVDCTYRRRRVAEIQDTRLLGMDRALQGAPNLGLPEEKTAAAAGDGGGRWQRRKQSERDCTCSDTMLKIKGYIVEGFEIHIVLEKC